MAVRRHNTAAKRSVKKAATPAKSDVTVYAEKEPTDYHKAFARWIVSEVGYDPNSAAGKKAAFLAGVSIATVARAAFMNSDFLEEWRAEAGISKRGPKPKTEAETTRRKTRQVVSDEEFEDDAEEEIEDEEELEDEELDEDDEFDDDEELDEDDEEEPEPAPRRRVAKKAVPAKRAPAKKAAPAKRTARAVKADDDDFIF